MTAGSLLPSHSKSHKGREAAALLGILLPDLNRRKGLLKGESLGDKCQEPRLSSQFSGYLAEGADNLFCCFPRPFPWQCSSRITFQPRTWGGHFLEKALQCTGVCKSNTGQVWVSLNLALSWMDNGTITHRLLTPFLPYKMLQVCTSGH